MIIIITLSWCLVQFRWSNILLPSFWNIPATYSSALIPDISSSNEIKCRRLNNSWVFEHGCHRCCRSILSFLVLARVQRAACRCAPIRYDSIRPTFHSREKKRRACFPYITRFHEWASITACNWKKISPLIFVGSLLIKNHYVPRSQSLVM